MYPMSNMFKSVLYPYFASTADHQGNTVADLHLIHIPCVCINFCTGAAFCIAIFLVNVEVRLFVNIFQLFHKNRSFTFVM